ncbi:MAG: PAS domain S-box protein [Desulfohalobiaceae bacterium]
MTPEPSYEELRNRVEILERKLEERQRTDEERTVRLRELETVFENSPDAFVTLDTSHRIVNWNKGAERIFGYSAEEAIGRDIDELISGEDVADEARDFTQRALAGEAVTSVESIRYARDGTPVHVLFYGTPIYRQNKLQRIVGVYTDMTARKRAEREQEQIAGKYRAIFENTGTATAIIEEDATISMVNTEFEELCGYSKEEIEGKTSFMPFVANQGDVERIASYHWQRRTEGASVPRKYETDIINRKGDIKNIFVTADLIPGTKQTVISLLDVTGYRQLQASYKQERDYLDQILEFSPDGIAIVNKHGEIVRFNRIAAELFGYTFEEIQGRRAFDFYADREEMERMLQTLRSQGSVLNYEIDFLRKDGQRLPSSVSINLLRDRQGYPTGSISIIRDLRPWKEMLQELREQQEKFRGIASSALDAVIMMDDQGRITFWNNAAEKIFGYTSEEALYQDLHELIAPEHQLETFRKNFPEFQRSGTGPRINESFEITALHKDGTEFPVELSLSTLKLGNAFHSVGLVKDISRRKMMEAKLQNMANTDQLTGAYNRHKFLEYLDYEISRVKRNNSPLSLVMFDIDHFKRINDTYGHGTGDETLRELVRITGETLRDVDILTRWGGEEFIVLTPDTDKLSASVLAERLRRTVEEHDFPGAGSVTISLGIVQYTGNEAIEDLINRVDERMYLAKRSGRNRVK